MRPRGNLLIRILANLRRAATRQFHQTITFVSRQFAQPHPLNDVPGLTRSRQAAVLADPPEVDGNQEEGDCGQHNHMKSIKAGERFLTDGMST